MLTSSSSSSFDDVDDVEDGKSSLLQLSSKSLSTEQFSVSVGSANMAGGVLVSSLSAISSVSEHSSDSLEGLVMINCDDISV